MAATNKEHFSLKEVQQADAARSLQGRLGWPSEASYRKYIDQGLIRNCPTTADDITQGNHIYGPLEALLKGKVMHKRPQHLTHIPRIQIPAPVLSLHPIDDIAADFFCTTKNLPSHALMHL